jgi:hypothetical protein
VDSVYPFLFLTAHEHRAGTSLREVLTVPAKDANVYRHDFAFLFNAWHDRVRNFIIDAQRTFKGVHNIFRVNKDPATGIHIFGDKTVSMKVFVRLNYSPFWAVKVHMFS